MKCLCRNIGNSIFIICTLLTYQLLIPSPLMSENINQLTETGGESLSLMYPTGGETFHIEDVIPISWSVNPDSVSFVLAFASLDSGKTWTQIMDTIEPAAAIRASEGIIRIDTLFWKPTLHDFGILLQEYIDANQKVITIRLRIRDYGQFFIDNSDYLTLSTTSIGIKSLINNFSMKMTYSMRKGLFHLEGDISEVNGNVLFYTTDGKLIKQNILPAYHKKHFLSITDLVSGAYILKVLYPGRRTSIIRFNILE